MKKILTNDDKIIKMYSDGCSIRSVAKSMLLSPSTVGRRLRAHNVLIRSPRKYTLNESFFDTIDNEKKASARPIYVIRLLYEDANVYLDRKYHLACEAMCDTPRYGARS